LSKQLSYTKHHAYCRLLCTLWQVIDATWEPVEVPIPPHRRSVPLTLEQLKAHMPPQDEPNPRPSGNQDPYWYPWDDVDEEEEEKIDEFGRVNRLLSAYGPPLTRLTANQALNTLKGKPMLCWLNEGRECISKRDTIQERLQDLEEVTFKDSSQSWPPDIRYSVLDDEFCFYGEYHTPTAMQSFWRDQGYAVFPGHAPGLKPKLVATYTDYYDEHALLRTTESSCREATDDEMGDFYDSTAASDADSFDMYLTFGRENDGLYVFLDPTRRRFTGRLKGTAAPQRGVVA